MNPLVDSVKMTLAAPAVESTGAETLRPKSVIQTNMCGPASRIRRRLTRFTFNHWLLLPILIWALLLRMRHINTVGVWFDESFLQRMVEFPWSEMLDRIGKDNHPPLFHVLLKFWSLAIGNTNGGDRILSVIFGVAGVAGTYAFTREAYRRDAVSFQENFLEADLPALLSAALVAMAPHHVYWGMQIRMYSLAVALAVWSSFFLFRALKTDKTSLGWWFAYTLTAILLSYTHYFGLFMLAAQYIYAAGYLWLGLNATDRRPFVPALVSGGLVAFAWLPWLPYFLKQQGRAQREFSVWPELSWNYLDQVSHEMWFGILEPGAPFVGLLLIQVAIFVVLILAMGKRPADYFVILSVVTPVVVAVALSMMKRSIIAPKYFLISHTFLLIAIALVACRIPRIGRYPVIGILLWGMFSVSLVQQKLWDRAGRLPGMKAAAARIDAGRGNEPLVITNPMLYCCALSYLRDRNHVYNIGRPGDFPYFVGTAVVPDDRYFGGEATHPIQSDSFWVLDYDQGSRQDIAAPSNWKLIWEEKYPEWYSNLALRLYSRIRS